MLLAKYCDHLPLYQQSGIYARDGIDLDRATIADWVGKMATLLRPLVEAMGKHVMAADKLHADDTPVPVLAPGNGKTKIGRLWVYLRDERPHGGTDPPAVLYRYTPDRKGEHPHGELAGFKGFLQADGYAGFGALYQDKDGMPATITEVAFWVHRLRRNADQLTQPNGGQRAVPHQIVDMLIGTLPTLGEFPDQPRKPPNPHSPPSGQPHHQAAPVSKRQSQVVTSSNRRYTRRSIGGKANGRCCT